ncbi:alpha/beta hydrolase family protein [Dietzia cinnamea]|uniref:alpha/beta hydrolase family protein n=1 Tax=Dietzia cinnamea TaxID=321318 RepID=UPI00223BEA8A|nr:alpha/beta hydrolase family protein [Dietzia cinnamea]MCT2174625.1 alpha/beta hydrolase family protein [Dietzia cinnamea]
MSPAQGADALAAAIDLAAVRAAEVGRRIADSAEDLDSVARRLGGRATGGEWSGRAGDRARGEVADAAGEARMLSGNCLFVADVLRAEGSRLARAVAGWDVAEAAEPGTGDAVAVQDADRVLAMRLREAADALAGRVDAATRPCLDLSGSTDDDPREVARLWHALGPADRARLARDHPELGSVDGLSSATRDALNRTRLRRLLDASGSAAGAGSGAGQQVSDEAARDLATLAAYLEQDPRRHLLDLHPDGRAVVASADPDSAERVVTLVPGTGSSLADLGRTGERAGAVCEAADAAGECVSVSWQGYDAPDGIVSAGSSAGPAWAHADDLRTYAAGLDAVEGLDGDDAPHATVGYSYGSVVLGAAAADPEGLAADLMIHVGSPGAGVESLDRQWVDEAGVSRPAVDDDVVAVASRWDPVPWWSITGVLGERPGTDEFGGRSVDVTEPGAGPESVRTAHSRYLDPGTVSLTEIGRLVSGIE